jgi:hypothetical protein
MTNDDVIPYRYVGGASLSSQDTILIPNIVAPGEVTKKEETNKQTLTFLFSQVVYLPVEMSMPAAPGRYVSRWQLVAPDGSPFGDVVFVDVEVQPEDLSDAPAEQPAKETPSSPAPAVSPFAPAPPPPPPMPSK